MSENEKKLSACRAALNDDAKVRLIPEYAAAPYNAWLSVTDEQPFRALHSSLLWRPKLSAGNGDGIKFIMFEREDGAGYVLPGDDGWWAAFDNNGSYWHHHAFGAYANATAAAMAFDAVYELERFAGNVDRCPRLKAENAA